MSGNRPGDWFESELATHDMTRELQRLKRRARARPVRTVGLALLVSLAVVAYKAHKSRHYKAKIILRVAEGVDVDQRAPLPKSKLENYIETVPFNNAGLLKIIDKYGLYPLRRLRGDELAIEKFRDNIDVDVFANYFNGDNWITTGPRTARIAVTFRALDRQLAINVVRALAARIVQSEDARRRQASEFVTSVAEAALKSARGQQQARQSAMDARTAALAQATRTHDEKAKARLEVQIDTLRGQIVAGQKVVATAQRRFDTLKLRESADRAHLGLTFNIADERLPARAPDSIWYPLTMLGGVCFLLFLPIAAVAVGAFDRRVHETEDVARLGLTVFGRIPAFPGDDIGALDRRGARRDRVP